MNLNVVVVCHAGSSPAIYCVKVECTQEQYETGMHYQEAIEHGRGRGFYGPWSAFDETDGPDDLFNVFDWDDVPQLTAKDEGRTI